MTTFTLRSGAHHNAKRPPINPLHLLVRGFYVLAGIAALASVYARLQLVLADPIFSAIATLMLAMAFIVVTAPRARRP
ncbi:hypothetical protein [Sphingomonas pituitosa]|uniref:hypothetical protein n=1 Tax=Sphingomonas pituitosa TaxID=99597 RepID=UPI000832CC17|nr:hypothetical protein [Sphingomonas pituitosa]